MLSDAHDTAQLEQAWNALDDSERAMPELAIQAATRLMALHGSAQLARQWLLTIWDSAMQPGSILSDSLRVKLIGALEPGLESLDAPWLARIEAAQLAKPSDANLQYLVGMACMSRQLWGKARQWLSLSVLGLQDASLRRNAYRALASLAEQRGDANASLEAYQQAAKS